MHWLNLDWQSRLLWGFNRIPTSFRVGPWVSQKYSGQSKGGNKHVFNLPIVFQDDEAYKFSACEDWKLGVTYIVTVYHFPNPEQGHMFMEYEWTYGNNAADIWNQNR